MHHILYRFLATLARLAVRSGRSKDLEIVVLRHQLAVLRRILPNVTVTLHEGLSRFDSLDAWIHTDVRGWTLADMIDDDQYVHLLAAAKRELADFVDDNGRVRFPAPALTATAHVPVSDNGCSG